MKIAIKDLEKKLGYPIKKNFKVVSFDTAEICGVAFIKTDDKYAHFDWCYLEFQKESEEQLLTQMYKEFGKLITDENFCVVEAVFVGLNRAGSLILAKMGTMACAQCVQKNIPFKLISAVSARSKLKIDVHSYGKGNSKKAVLDWCQNLGIDITEENSVDAIALACLGICEGLDFKPTTKKAKKKKVSKKKKKIVKKSKT
jgi:Holliday junction resolvasome RuvABC endonuclease subunit